MDGSARLTSKHQVAKLVRVLLRAENLDHRGKLLELLLRSKCADVMTHFRSMHALLIIQSFISETWAMKCVKDIVEIFNSKNSKFDASSDKESANNVLQFINTCLNVLFKLPVKSRTELSSSKIKPTIQRIVAAFFSTDLKIFDSKEVNENLRRASVVLKEVLDVCQKILSCWDKVKEEYRIPRKDVMKL